jgi:hypothetical protein
MLGKPLKQIKYKCHNLGLKLSKEMFLKSQLEMHKKKLKKYTLPIALSFINFKNPYFVYLLGFVWAEGFFDEPTKTVSIEISTEDEAEITKICSKTIKWRTFYRHRETAEKNGKIRHSITYKISNKIIFNFFKKYDYLNRVKKEPVKILSKIPKEMLHYWWLGYFDGDGSAVRRTATLRPRFVFCGDYEQKWNFLNVLESQLNIKFSVEKRILKKGRGSTAALRKIGDIIKIRDFLYQNRQTDGIGFERKFNKLKNLCYLVKWNYSSQTTPTNLN